MKKRGKKRKGLPRGIAGCCHSCHKGGVCKSSRLGKALRKKR